MKHVPHLYLRPPWGLEIEPSPDQTHHISQVLRVKPNDRVSYTDGAGVIGSGTWTDRYVVRGDEAELARPTRLVVAVAPPANRDRLRFTVEKLAELGVEALLWLETRHGNRRLPKSEKIQSWARSALEQSRGAWMMSVDDSLVAWSDLEAPVVVCDRDGSDDAVTPRTVVVGPEGGFGESEIPDGLERRSLGPTVLRVETAAIAAAIKFHH